MPIIGSFGAGSAGGFGQRKGGLGPFIVASGGTITTDGDYKIHTFTASGCFSVTSAGFPVACGGDGSYVDYLVVAAGGDGSEGGGGGGGMRSTNRTYPTSTGSAGSTPTSGIQVTEATTYPIIVGSPNPAPRGGDSSFGPITSTGGGQGGRIPPGAHVSNPGGSGGGGGHRMGGGTGNQPPVSPPQGNPGAPPLSDTTGTPFDGKGGGGMGSAGSTGNGSNGGQGGNGGTSDISGTSTIYAAGGGGGVYSNPTGPGGTAGGPSPTTSGAGGASSWDGKSGQDGRGGGAGFPSGTSNPPGLPAVGGAGVVVIRYKFQ